MKDIPIEQANRMHLDFVDRIGEAERYGNGSGTYYVVRSKGSVIQGGTMCFDDCREDIIEGYCCECGGSITKSLDGTTWTCDTCDFTASSANSKAEDKEKND